MISIVATNMLIMGTQGASLITEMEYGIEQWNGTMEWKMEWNSEHTQLQLTCVTGTAQSRLNYLVYL